MSDKNRILITCEHGGNRIPSAYKDLFRGHEALLKTHRGYDPGALTMAREMARAMDAPLHVSTISRLLIDLNRSIGHPRLYSEATRSADTQVRRKILEQYYLPYRESVESDIRESVSLGYRVIHISSHSFTPELDGDVRNGDIGLLYDPARAGEEKLCARWQVFLRKALPHLTVRRNYPYTGKSDGFTAYLRRCFSEDVYWGIELEINQRIVFHGGSSWRFMRTSVIDALQKAIN